MPEDPRIIIYLSDEARVAIGSIINEMERSSGDAAVENDPKGMVSAFLVGNAEPQLQALRRLIHLPGSSDPEGFRTKREAAIALKLLLSALSNDKATMTEGTTQTILAVTDLIDREVLTSEQCGIISAEIRQPAEEMNLDFSIRRIGRSEI